MELRCVLFRSISFPWAGITRFKTRYVKPGVTGKEIAGTGARDLVLDKTFYSLFRIYKLFHG